MAQQDSSGEPGSQPPAADRAEMERLRAEVAQLRARQTGRAGRWVAAATLLLIAVLLGIASIVAVFVRNQLLDTDRYVATVAPLARDPVVQDAIADRLTSEIITRTDVDALVHQAADFLKKQGAPAQIDALVSPAVNGVESFVHSEVRKIVGSRYFAQAWDSANRVGHASLVKILTGEGNAPVSSTDTTVSIDLGAVLEQVKQRLVDAGFGIAARIPRVPIQYTVYESSDLPKIRNYVRWLERAAVWLPLVALGLLIAGIAVAPNRRRGLLMGGLFIAVGLLLARGAFAVLRTYYLDHLPPEIQSPTAAEHIIDTVLRNVREPVQLLVLLGLLMAAVGWLAGPGRVAVGLRRVVNRILGGCAAGVGRIGTPMQPVRRVAVTIRRPAQVVILALAAFLLFLEPSTATALRLAAGVLVVLAIIEILARIPVAAPAPGSGRPGLTTPA
jgi:hypothetical protein